MNKYLKSFLHRGLIFGGFGPVVAAIVFGILEICLGGISLSGKDVFVGIISTYALAFIHAGASIFNQIEEWPVTKSLLCHFTLLFVTYSLCYLINSWIPFDPVVILIFCAIFIATYFTIWFTVYFVIKRYSKKLNAGLYNR